MKIPWNPWNRVESMKFHWKSTNIHETHEHKLTSMKTREHLSFWSSTGNFEGPTITRSWFLTTIGRGDSHHPTNWAFGTLSTVATAPISLWIQCSETLQKPISNEMYPLVIYGNAMKCLRFNR
jgi:hypothetical protein